MFGEQAVIRVIMCKWWYSQHSCSAKAQRGVQDGGAAPPGPAAHADQRDRHQPRVRDPDRGVPHPLHHHRGRQDQVLPQGARLLLRQRGHAQAPPLRHVQVGCSAGGEARGCTVVRRYDIGNCLFEAAYDEVLDRCGCTPYYHWGVVDLPTILEQRPFCKVSSENRNCEFFKLSKIHIFEYIDISKQNWEHLCLSFYSELFHRDLF